MFASHKRVEPKKAL